jgi:hypothetical protein
MGPTLPPGGHHTAWCLQAQLATHAWHLPWGSQGLGALGWGVEVSMLLLHPGKLHNRQATQTHPPLGMPACERVQQCALGPCTAQPITAKCNKAQQSAAKYSNAQQSTAMHSNAQQCTAKYSNVQQCTASKPLHPGYLWVTPTTPCVNFEYSKVQQS